MTGELGKKRKEIKELIAAAIAVEKTMAELADAVFKKHIQKDCKFLTARELPCPENNMVPIKYCTNKRHPHINTICPYCETESCPLMQPELKNVTYMTSLVGTKAKYTDGKVQVK